MRLLWSLWEWQYSWSSGLATTQQQWWGASEARHASQSQLLAAAITAKKFLVLAEDIHNAILDELEGGDVLADELKQPML